MTRARRIALAGGAATLVLFVWGAFSHLLIIRGVGYAPIHDEDGFVRGLTASGIEPGLYAFPAPPDWRGEEVTDAGAAAWDRRFRAGPSGMLIVRPHGEGPFSARKLLVQLSANALSVALALFVTNAVHGAFWRRAAAVAAVGLIGLSSVGVIYWNWYAFPDAFLGAQVFDVMGGWLLVGCTLSALLPHPRQADDRDATASREAVLRTE